MLEAIRKHISGIFAKILIGLLVVSFAVWGIGDMVRTYGQDVVANVGSQTISTQAFRTAYQLQLDGLARQFGRRLTPQEAKLFGIERQVLSRLTGAAAVDNHANQLNLGISDKAVEKSIFEDPSFRGLDGSFSQVRLQDALRGIRYTEQRFFEERRRDTLRDQITASLLANVTVPKVMTDILVTFRNEMRTADYFEVTAAKAVKLGEPTEADLQKTYETNKRRFVTPEFRKFEALLITAKAAKEKLKISEADLKTFYEADKASFAVPEKRRVQQISFKDEATAAAAKAEIAAGKSFLDVATAAGAKETDINLGLMTKDALIDPKIAEAAFKLEKNAVSDPVKGSFTTVLLRVTEIQAGEVRGFEAVKADIRSQIENDRVAEKVLELQNNVDDNRLAGKSLKEIGELLKLPFVAVAAADREGKGPDGKPAHTDADASRLVAKAFQSEVGVENDVLQLSQDGLGWLNLVAVTPEKQKPYADVAADVKRTWTEIETRKKLSEIAGKLADRVNAGEAIEAVAKVVGASVKKTPSFKRGDSVPDVPPAAVSRVFALEKGRAAAASAQNADTRLVLRVAEVTAPKPLAEADAKALATQATDQMRADIVAQYVESLKKRMNVSINQALVDLTTGATATTRYQ